MHTDADKRIIDAVIAIGSSEGVPKASLKRVAAACGVTHPVVLNRFGSTRESWDAAAEYVDRCGMAAMESFVEQGLSQREVWDAMLDFYLDHSDQALFYASYVATVGFDPTENNPRNLEFLRYAREFFGAIPGATDRAYLLYWDYLTSMLFYYVEKIVHGFLPNDRATRAMTRQIVFRGIESLAEAPAEADA